MSASCLIQDEQNNGQRVVETLGDVSLPPLPDGWIGVNHKSGGIIYLHKKSRVVTWSRPYSIGAISLRKHDVPVVAIPCLHQIINLMKYGKEDTELDDGAISPLCKRFKHTCEADTKPATSSSHVFKGPIMDANKNDCHLNTSCKDDKNNPECSVTDCKLQNSSNAIILDTTSTSFYETGFNDSTICSSNIDKTTLNMPKDKNEVEVMNKKRSLDGFKSEIHKCPIETFSGENIELIQSDQLKKYLERIFNFKNLTQEEAQRPIFGEGSRDETKLELPDALKSIPFNSFSKAKVKDSFVFKPGKTHLAMLNEYCNKNLKKSIEWVDTPGEGDSFVVEAVIEGVKYGIGEERSKKAAKQLAAKHTLEILIPDKLAEISNFTFSGKEFEVFDKLDIDDPTVADCTRSVGLPLPAEVLSICLRRNRKICDANIYFKLNPSETNDLHTFEITCGKHSAMGKCKNRSIGKQLASQAILKKIHPKLEKWGQLIRLYCKNPEGLIRESKKLATEDYPKLPEAKAELMRKLKDEMRKLEKERKSKLKTQSISSSTSTKSAIIGKDVDL